MSNWWSDRASWPVWNTNSPSSDPEKVDKIVSEFMTKTDSMTLDVGGTMLGFIRYLPATAPHDLEQRIRLVNKKGKKRIYRRNMGAVPESDRYNLIMSFGTLMYMGKKEIRFTFEKAHRLLAPGGTILISDMDGGNFWVWVELAMKWVAKLIFWGLPWRAHSKKAIVAMMRQAGFEITDRPDLQPSRGGLLAAISSMRYYVVAGVKPATLSPHHRLPMDPSVAGSSA